MFTEFEPTADLNNLEQSFFTMFCEEWRRQRGETPLGRVAIVDDDPTTQYLYPEMRLFERMFARFGAESVIADARELIWRDGRLWHGAATSGVGLQPTDGFLSGRACSRCATRRLRGVGRWC